MSKKTTKSITTVNGKIIDISQIQQIVDRNDYKIIGATLKDGFCNYKVKILQGQMQGEKSTHDGPLIISDDLLYAFRSLNKHLAVLDDAFENQEYEINDLEGNMKAEKYTVDSFIIRGADENIQVKLCGSKFLSSVAGRMECKTPFILLDAGTDYKWYNELHEELMHCQREVSLYKEGKGMHPEEPIKKKKTNQTKITDLDTDESEEKE